ncbi:DNA-binding protein inhibitor ID-1 [Liasis olivaceus]
MRAGSRAPFLPPPLSLASRQPVAPPRSPGGYKSRFSGAEAPLAAVGSFRVALSAGAFPGGASRVVCSPAMKVVPAATPAMSPGPSCALKGVRLGAGGAGEPLPRCLSEQSVSLSRAGGPPPRGSPLGPEQAAAAASLLMDMKGCYSRLAALVPTLPRHRRVSKVEILQHVIDYIWDLQLELQDPLVTGAPPPRGVDEPAGAEPACVNADDRILCR